MGDLFDMTFEISGKPIPKARPRLGKFGNVYTPKRTKDYEELVQKMFLEHGGIRKRKMTAPVHVKMYFYMPIPAKNKGQQRLGSEGVYGTRPGPSLARPDIDNLVKAVLDGLNGFAFADDSQVFRLEAVKLVGDKPRTLVGISWL